jgi:secondary thiamine-phosphate synthase enzyme
MEIVTEQITVSTQGNSEIIDITDQVVQCVKKHSMQEGQVTVFVVGSTALITTTEYEPGLRKDIPEMLERIIPRSERYHHDDTWGDGNGHSHVRAAMIGPSLSVPFMNGQLALGTWQQIILIDCDTRPRRREIIIQMMGK